MFSRYFTSLRILVIGLSGLICSHGAIAQTTEPGAVRLTPPSSANINLPRTLELSTGFQNLSAGFGSWRDLTLRGTYGLPSHLLQGELSLTRRFNMDGVFVGLSDTFTLNEDWYANFSAGFGDGAFYLPRYRLDSTVYKKWLPSRNLVTSVGAGFYKAPDGHSDSSLSLGLVYYFDAPWVAEGGIRLNSSNPGAIKTQQQFLAVTYGRDKQDLVTVRHGWGAEGYQTIMANAQLVNFKSSETSFSWRHWLAPQTGISMAANHYTNPFYKRSGLNIGFFHNF